MSETEVKICRDCKWYSEAVYLQPEDLCRHKAAKTSPSVITGNYSYVSCLTARESATICGPEAKLWEEKQSIWKQIKLHVKPKSKS